MRQQHWMITPLVALALAVPAGGLQAAPIPRDSLLLAHEFSEPRSEFARVTLEAGQVYRLEVTGARAAQVRTLLPGVQQPVVAQLPSGTSASGTVVFELRPFATALYEVRVSDLTGGSAPVRIYWDADASKARQKIRHH